jgi:hypothetical protein
MSQLEQAAELARLNELRHYLTPAESALVPLPAAASGGKPFGGMTLTQLAAEAETGRAADALERARLRQRLDLLAVDCAEPASAANCRCLTLALDLALGGELQGKAEILKVARKLHQPREPKIHLPIEPPDSTHVHASKPPPDSPVQPQPIEPPRPFRGVHRTRKWFDPPDGHGLVHKKF